MALTNSQIEQIASAIVATYDYARLRNTVRRFMEIDLDTIVGRGDFGEVVWALIEWAERHNRLVELVGYLASYASRGSELRKLWDEAQEPFVGLHMGSEIIPAQTTNVHRVKTVRIDAAVPNRVRHKTAFTLAVAVRNQSSPVINEADLTKVASGDALVEQKDDETYVRLRIEVIAPDCQLSTSSLSFRWYPENDAPVYKFSLVPLTSGQISVIIQLYQEVDCIGTASVRTRVSKQPVGKVELVIDSGRNPDLKLVGQQILMFRHALVAAFNEQGLRELVKVCFDTDLEAIAGGENLNAIAFNLIEWAQRHGLTRELAMGAWLANPYNPDLVAFKLSTGL